MKYPILLAVIIAAGVMAACESPDKSDSSSAAVKVGQDMVTEAEIERALAGLNAAGADKDKLKSTVVEALVTQKLLVQEAKKAGLDKKPEVALDAAAAQRQVIAKAYAESLPGMQEQASTQSVEDYYRQHPNLFTNRRIYRLQEVQIEATQDRLPAIQDQLGKSRTLGEFVEWLKSQGLKGSIAGGVKSSEQVPEQLRDRLAGMQQGGVVLVPSDNGISVISIAEVQTMPMTLEQATPAIKKILLEKKQKEVLEAEVRKLKQSAKIEYADGYAPPSSQTR
ncbi:MAG: peptidyl-prolyl cis-trans isomerase, EpsD family [Hydrogenophilaceae bacterium]|nr:peptidyl-prolyl cis-trans isomerase, EpsD family [Hydrogenophilaceae bacterium]